MSLENKRLQWAQQCQQLLSEADLSSANDETLLLFAALAQKYQLMTTTRFYLAELKEAEATGNFSTWLESNLSALEDIAVIEFLTTRADLIDIIFSRATLYNAFLNSKQSVTLLAYHKNWLATWLRLASVQKRFSQNAAAMAIVAQSIEALEIIVASPFIMEVMAKQTAAMNAFHDSDLAVTLASQSATAVEAIAASELAIMIFLDSRKMMTAVGKNEQAMWSVAKKDNVTEAIVTQTTAIKAIAPSEVALNALASSSSFWEAVIKNDTARNTIIKNNNAFQSVRAKLYELVKNSGRWKKHRDYKGDSNRSMSHFANAIANPAGMAFACLGYNSGYENYKTHFYHSDRSLAVYTSGPRTSVSNRQDGVSFNGASVSLSSQSYVEVELWIPKDDS